MAVISHNNNNNIKYKSLLFEEIRKISNKLDPLLLDHDLKWFNWYPRESFDGVSLVITIFSFFKGPITVNKTSPREVVYVDHATIF